MRVAARGLNVRSGPGTHFRILTSLPQGADVTVVEEHDGWAYVDPFRGWVARRYLEETAPEAEPPLLSLSTPRGLGGIKALFGTPGGPQCTQGIVKLPAPLKLSWARETIMSFRCHGLIADKFTRVFQRIYDAGLWGALHTFGGCFNDRKQRGGSKVSTHAWGISVDLNPAENPLGTKGEMHPRIVEIFEEEGFEWGGRWARPDPMHFQFATGY